MSTNIDFQNALVNIEQEKLKVMKQQLEVFNAIGIAIQNIDEKLEAVLRDKGIDVNDP